MISQPQGSAFIWVVLQDFAVSQNFQVGVTTLLAFTDYGSTYEELAAIVRNDGTSPNAVDMVADVSHGGALPNTELTQTKTCPLGDERRIYLGPPNPDTYLRLQVNNAGAQCTGTWALLGRRRRPW